MRMRRGIIRGQTVEPARLALAKAFRREMTSAERALWAHLRRNQLGGFHFRRQQIVDGFVLDFYCHRAGLVVEIDGPVHAAQTDYDAQRTAWLAARGLRVIRFPNADVERDLEAVLASILAACSLGAGQDAPSPP
jgi:very-short-patch-repair endonuclease